MSKNFRQGDVYLFPVSKIPAKVKKDEKSVLAYGEVTGHRHQIIDGEVFVDDKGQMFLRASDKTELHHLDEAQRQADHAPLKISEGDYRVVIQEEYQPAGWTRVAD